MVVNIENVCVCDQKNANLILGSLDQGMVDDLLI